ncbi:hypothetical protein MTR67_007880 [Solanum verrucosum]|uniref:Reverse transcriptase n=1 Tax=Solanum verrucosum TaxID=315347 RepID=A0AAF0Q2S6_SOLVR|nr:hypothetical protein MTR67_007880 [Solanum verrucosum]
MNSDGNTAQTQEEIELEVSTFYKNFLGKVVQMLPSVNAQTMKNGKALNREQQLLLVARVTREEVEFALKSIHDMKAPRIDGFNVFFFKKAWTVVEENIMNAVLKFFDTGYMGDIKSVRSLYKCFMVFFNASGLVANVDKSCVYFGGIKQNEKEQILQELQFVKGELPFRAQLVKSVLFSIQTFWAQIFALPKKIIHAIESICRKFLWTSSVEASKKALISREKLCWPKASGGLNFLDVFIWNNAAIGKLLWNLYKKKDKLWVEWIHSYYEQRGIWGIQANQASWLVQRILKAHKHLQVAGYNEHSLYQMEQYSIKKVYEKMRGDREKVEFRKYGPTMKLLAWQGIQRTGGKWHEEIQWATTHMKNNPSKAKEYRMVLAGTIYHVWLERNNIIFQSKQRNEEFMIRHIISLEIYMEEDPIIGR